MRRFWLVLLAAGMVFSACEKLNLKRDNPLDLNNPDYVGEVDNPDNPGTPDEPDDDLEAGVVIRYDGYKVILDGNGDGVINKGEYIQLDVCLKNHGASKAVGIKATFSTKSVYVFGTADTAEYGDITAGEKMWSGGSSSGADKAFGFMLSTDVPDGTKIPVKMDIRDAYGNKWEDSLLLTVERTGARIGLSRYLIRNDRDGSINNGEYIQLDVCLKNSGTSNAMRIKATFSTKSEYAFGPAEIVEYGDIAVGDAKWAGGSRYSAEEAFAFTVSKDVPSGTLIPIDIDIEDELGNKWNDCLSLTVEGTGALIQYDGYKVSYDGNSDGVINKGEYVRLDVCLKNTGTSTANGVKAVFSTESVYASDFESGEFGVVEYGAISAGATKWSGVFGKAFGFTVSKEAPSGTTIPIKIAIEDAQGNQWEDSLSLMVEGTGALIQYDGYKVSYDGNGDGVINKGEYVRLDVCLKNTGTSTANGIKAVFSTESAYASDFESGEFGVVEYDAISAGAAKWSGVFGKAFGFTVSKEAPSGTTIPIKIAIEDAQGNQWEDTFMLEVAD